MLNRYSVKELHSKFLEHAEKAQKNHQEQLANFIESYPDKPIPDVFKDAFNLPLALACICEEIDKISQKLEK